MLNKYNCSNSLLFLYDQVALAHYTKKTPKIKTKTYKGEKTKTKNLTSEREIKQNAVT